MAWGLEDTSAYVEASTSNARLYIPRDFHRNILNMVDNLSYPSSKITYKTIHQRHF